jgi:hypothetical protein
MTKIAMKFRQALSIQNKTQIFSGGTKLMSLSATFHET